MMHRLVQQTLRTRALNASRSGMGLNLSAPKSSLGLSPSRNIMSLNSMPLSKDPYPLPGIRFRFRFKRTFTSGTYDSPEENTMGDLMMIYLGIGTFFGAFVFATSNNGRMNIGERFLASAFVTIYWFPGLMYCVIEERSK